MAQESGSRPGDLDGREGQGRNRGQEGRRREVVKNGVARLTGTVDSGQQRLGASIVARSTRASAPSWTTFGSIPPSGSKPIGAFRSRRRVRPRLAGETSGGPGHASRHENVRAMSFCRCGRIAGTCEITHAGLPTYSYVIAMLGPTAYASLDPARGVSLSRNQPLRVTARV